MGHHFIGKEKGLTKSNVFFISDLHLQHHNMAIKRGFRDSEEMWQTIKKNWNSVTNKHSVVYILGDVGMEKSSSYSLLSELNGLKYVVLGNHEKHTGIDELLKYVHGVAGMIKYKKKIFLTHCPIHPCELDYRVTHNIHGHCVDDLTEILTIDGWKNYQQIKKGEAIYSYDSSNKKLVGDTINDIIVNKNYKGYIYNFKGKGLDMCITDKHRVVFTTKSGKFLNEVADEAFNRSTITLYKSFLFENEGIELSDNMLRLYIHMAADGNIQGKLGRFNLKKERKIENIKSLLEEMKIDFSLNTSRGFTRINFKIPNELKRWNIKGLDKKLINCNRWQAEVVRNSYRESDGNRNLIFTSKTCEMNILQQLFILNGFQCKVFSRKNHGYSKNISYQLSVTDTTQQIIPFVKNRAQKEYTNNKLMWCVKTTFGNFIARRNGCVFLTGNCHENSLEDSRYINVSCEVVNYTPKRLEELITLI